MHVILERVKIDLDEDEIQRLIDAVDHYEAYLHSQHGTRRSSGSYSCGCGKCWASDRKAGIGLSGKPSFTNRKADYQPRDGW